MKKTFIFGLIAAALGFTACSSEDDLNVNDNNQKKGMVLRATVEQPAESRATFTDNEGVWQFAFATGDNVSVTNIDMTPDFYTFTNEGTEFKCEKAKAAESEITWYAYFPSNEVSLVGQSGTKADVANKYALAGKSSATTGEEGLNITMSPKVAILVINNQKGSIDINVKNSATTWVSGLTANNDGFNVTTSTTQQNLLSVTTKGTYYVAVPAGVQLAVKDGDKVIRSTNGLTAGKYYNLTIATTGYAAVKPEAGISGNKVKWIQLWENGPKFAEFNVGSTSGAEYGAYYTWGGSDNVVGVDVPTYNTGTDNLTSTDDTATNLWGTNWRMPTSAEFEHLLENCDLDWTTVAGMKYIKFTGKGDYSSNSVFLPAACYSEWGDQPTFLGDCGFYWSSTTNDSNGELAYALQLFPGIQPVDEFYRNIGFSVRAVLVEE